MNITSETLALFKMALAKADDQLAKSITTGTGLVAFDLQAPAKNLYPVLSPLRNSIPRVGGEGGVATNWRQITAITGSGFDASPWVAEGQRTARMSYTTSNKAANYVTIGEEDQISYEAVSAGQGFEDLQATMTVRLLQKMMIKEEDAIIGGNASVALGVPTTPTVSYLGAGTLPGATYSVIVVALSYEGLRNATKVAPLACAVQAVVTGADGLTFTLNPGTSNKSAAGANGASGGLNLNVSTPVVPGAVGYAWYIGTAGAEKLEAFTTINSYTRSTPLAATGQAATAITADWSRNASLAFDGILTTAFQAGSLATVVTQPTGTAGTGTVLTSSTRGSINEIDQLFQTMWDNYRISPTVIYVNSQEMKNMLNKILTGAAAAPLIRFVMDNNGVNSIQAGQIIGSYLNPFSTSGGLSVPIRIHPTLPAGTILTYCENLPAQYQSNNVPNVAEVKTRRDYYQIDWPLRTRQRESGVYAEEVLAVYATFGIGVVTNIANG